MRENIERIHDEDMQKWRKAMFAANLIFAAVIFMMEILLFAVLEIQNLQNQPLMEYLFQYLFLPTAFDLIILLVGYILMQIRKEDATMQNAIPLVQMTLMCFVLSTIHHVFFVTFATFCFPVFISGIFGERKITRGITILSIVCLTIMQYVGPRINDVDVRFLFTSYLIAVAIVLCANVLCNLLMRYEYQKDRKLEMLYRSRMEIMDQLKYDQKTGLYGHTSFQTGLKKLVDEAELRKRPAVAVLDIDDFKKVNDTYGHVKGDMVILELARIMREACGDKYTAARFGGEEFAILFQNGTLDDYIRTVEMIRQEMERTPFDFRPEPVTISAGVAIWKRGWGTTEFFDRADEALYISKRQGKNRTTVCDGDSVKSASLYHWLKTVPDKKK